ncbi:MAG: ABC transporter substrate-binding protein [Oscillospiraceae bacterium]|nr:ABC transporter substrate-binding protein [Oscillospiraceae bacterium]
MKRNRKSIAIMLVLVMAAMLLAACGPAADTGGAPPTGGETVASPPAPGAPPVVDGGDEIAEAPEEGANLADHIDIIVDTQITVLNSTLPGATGAPVTWAATLVHDRLLQHIDDTELGPQLATHWNTDDFQTFTFTLRDDVVWHNGDPFTAECVVLHHAIIMEHPGSPAYTRWRWIDSITATGTYELEMVLTEVFVDFLFEMANPHASIYNARSFNENSSDPSWAWVGTGPFQVVGFEINDFLTVERFDAFWGEAPPTRSLTLWTIPEMGTRTVMLQTGAAQLSFGMTPEDLDSLDDNPAFQMFTVMPNAPMVIGFNNMGDDIMMDKNFRLAIAHAINTDDIALVANGRWAVNAFDGNIWGLITQFRLDGLEKREHNLELALQYLEQSVYNGETIELIAAGAYNIRAAEIIQLQLAEIGIDLAVEITDMAGFTAAHLYDPESTRQLHTFAIGAMPIALAALRNTYYPGVHTNRLNYNDDRVTALTRELAVTSDVAAREAIAFEIQEIFWEDLPAIPVWWRVTGIPAVNGIGGIRLFTNQFDHCLRGIFWDINETEESLRP